MGARRRLDFIVGAGIFFSSWLVGGITRLAIVLLVWPLISKGLARVRGRAA